MDKKAISRCRPFHEYIPEEAWEHTRAARKELREGIKSLFPSDFFGHRQAARKEMLLAMRSVIEAALEKIETGEKSS